jgi:hypothetical protein
MTRQEILDRLCEKVGKPLSRLSDPSYWSLEDRGRAASYEAPLGAVRAAYASIKAGNNPVKVLSDLRDEVQDTEHNSINRLIEAIQEVR